MIWILGLLIVWLGVTTLALLGWLRQLTGVLKLLVVATRDSVKVAQDNADTSKRMADVICRPAQTPVGVVTLSPGSVRMQ